MHSDPFAQDPYRCRLEWGRHGARRAAERGDILVIVDTLSFASTTVTAIQHGAIIYPCAHDEDPASLARRVGGEAAVARDDVPHKGRFSLSPLTYVGVAPGTHVVVQSPNGATCSRYAPHVPALLVGSLLNAAAVAAVVTRLLATTASNVTVLACGERWLPPSEDGDLRFAIEDALAAGAILAYLSDSQSPEARFCAGAFAAIQNDLAAILWECGSGQELRARGFGADAEHAARLNLYTAVPIMRTDRFEPWTG
jgi:2-phosphosulfolactate phosphatase